MFKVTSEISDNNPTSVTRSPPSREAKSLIAKLENLGDRVGGGGQLEVIHEVSSVTSSYEVKKGDEDGSLGSSSATDEGKEDNVLTSSESGYATYSVNKNVKRVAKSNKEGENNW